MANRVTKQEFSTNKLVLKEFIRGESVPVKTGESFEYGDVLILDTTERKYVKYVKATHKTNLATAILRVYKDETPVSSAKEGTRVVVLRQGEVDSKLLKAEFETEKDADDYALIAQLERLNIILEEVE